MNRCLAPERRTCKLATTVRDHFVDVHVELGAAARHPHVQREHVMMLAGEDFVAHMNDQLVALIVEPLAGMIGNGSGFLQGGVGGDHLAGNEIPADAEMLQRPLRLRAPQLVSRHLNHAEAVSLSSQVVHVISPACGVGMLKQSHSLSTNPPLPRAEHNSLSAATGSS